MDKVINLFIEGTAPINLGVLNYKTDLDFWTIGCMYQGLMMFDEHYHLVNRVIDSYKYDSSTKTINVCLKDAMWSDGSKITSEDIKESLKYRLKYTKTFKLCLFMRSLKNFNENNLQNNPELLPIRIINDKEFVISVQNKDVYLKNIFLLPFENSKNSVKFTSCKLGKQSMVGCGPFIPYFIDTEKIQLKRNNFFHLGKPIIKDMNIYYGNRELKKQMVLNKEIDFFCLDMLELDMLNILPNEYEIYPLDSLQTTNISFNLNKKLFKDIKNRTNFFYMIDRNKLIEDVCGGYAEPLGNFYPNIIKQRFQLEIKKNSVELRQSYKGVEITIGYLDGNKFHEKVAIWLANELRKYIKIKIKGYKNINHAFENETDFYIHDLKHQIMPLSNQYFYQNKNNFMNKEFAKLLYLNNNLCNNDAGKDDMMKFEQEIERVIPMIPLFSVYDIQVIKNKFKNLEPDGRGVLWNIHKIDY